jgi:cullin 3
MVLHKQGDKLYEGVQMLIRDHMKDVTEKVLYPVFPKSESESLSVYEEYLRTLKAVWSDHTLCLVMIRDILLYMV